MADITTTELIIFIVAGMIVSGIVFSFLQGVIKNIWKAITSGKVKKVSTGPFTIEANDDEGENSDDQLKALDELRVQIGTLQATSRKMEARLFLMERIAKDKQEFYLKVSKFATRFVGRLEDNFRDYLVGRENVPVDIVMKLDDFSSIKDNLELLRHQMVRRAMEDWDNNGFHKIGKTIDGNSDAMGLQKYHDDKVHDFKSDVTRILQKNSDKELIIKFPSGKMVKKPTLLQPSEIHDISAERIKELGAEIVELYNTAINGSYKRHKKYNDILKGEKTPSA